jgi:GT2 family glycosyltransferase
MLPKVTILLLNYNRYNDTIECIDSLNKCTYQNYEIMIVDNCSTDESFESLVSKYSTIEIIRTEQNEGYTGGINWGLKYILEKKKTEYILILNNDTLVETGFLEPLVNALENNEQAAAACGTILAEHDRKTIWFASGEIVGWRGLAVHINKGEIFRSENHPSIKNVSFITGCMIFLRVNCLESIGLLDNRFFMYLDDIELSLRITKNRFQLLYVPQSVIYHKVIGEKESAFKLYYSVRNRLLLISVAFHGLTGKFAYSYFCFVMMLKIFFWSFTNKPFARASFIGLKDYFNKNFYKGNGFLFYNN